jgi:DNA-binding CsgD family transcriptional regulator
MAPPSTLQRFFFFLTSGLPWVKRAFPLDDQLFEAVQRLSEQDGRPPEELAADLVAIALAQREQLGIALEHWQALTLREQQIAAMVCLNYTDPQMAARLRITANTVRSHVRKLLSKFQVQTRSGLRMLLSESAGWDFAAWEAQDFNLRRSPGPQF